MKKLAALCLAATLASLAGPAPASAADRCKRAQGGPPLSVRTTSRDSADRRYDRSALVVCHRRTGRERVLRRAVYNSRARVGRRFGHTSAAGRRVAWIEASFSRTRSAFLVAVADGRTGRILRRTEVLAGATYDMAYFARVTLTTRGEVTWMAGPAGTDVRIVYERPGAPPRELARGLVAGLRLEDDGTAVWNDDLGIASFDMPTLDRGAGCPKRRAGYRVVSDFGGVVFTRMTRAPAIDEEVSYLRACDTHSGIDAIVGADSTVVGFGGTRVEPVGGGNGWAAVSVGESNRYDQCGSVALGTIEIATRRSGHGWRQNGCGGVPLSRRTVVTSAGAPAWTVGQGSETTLVAVDAEGTLQALDRGAIDALRADGEDVRWTNAGEPRSARP